jgi:hypothetical protein
LLTPNACEARQTFGDGLETDESWMQYWFHSGVDDDNRIEPITEPRLDDIMRVVRMKENDDRLDPCDIPARSEANPCT